MGGGARSEALEVGEQGGLLEIDLAKLANDSVFLQVGI